MNEESFLNGVVQRIIDYKDGHQEINELSNTILVAGKMALASTLTNTIGPSFNLYIIRMIFRDGGTLNGVPPYVDSGRNGLFGTTRLSPPVIALIYPHLPIQAIFTSVIMFADILGVTINEMALQMSSGNLYSMTTFPDFTKTAEQQLTFSWNITYL